MNLLYGVEELLVVVGREARLDHPQSERVGGGGEEEGRHPLPSQKEN